jgi:hypothetical protein
MKYFHYAPEMGRGGDCIRGMLSCDVIYIVELTIVQLDTIFSTRKDGL